MENYFAISSVTVTGTADLMNAIAEYFATLENADEDDRRIRDEVHEFSLRKREERRNRRLNKGDDDEDDDDEYKR